jgi:hypothetical protein
MTPRGQFSMARDTGLAFRDWHSHGELRFAITRLA